VKFFRILNKKEKCALSLSKDKNDLKGQKMFLNKVIFLIRLHAKKLALATAKLNSITIRGNVITRLRESTLCEHQSTLKISYF